MKTNTNYLIIYLLGLLLGLTFPDFDYFLADYIGHRSLFTHSILIVILFITLSKNKDDLKTANYLAGFSFGIVIHLISDLDFPSNLVGGKTIKFLLYDLGVISFYWLFGNILIGFYIAEKLYKKIDIDKKKYYLINLILCFIFIYYNSEIYLFLIGLFIGLSFIFSFLRKSLP
jgi:hypothetical protein